ncbi:DUF4192 domain-containing protein [Gordonia sp. CPCC 206044]|uniref:DUF4192 domain-containing protein n=1 Tax=Gordonia sp. CPCC 206044 TaxID=3140793 RepID=UPI003AF36B31
MSASSRPRPLTPSALITAVPAMLGFLPERSVILLAFDTDPRVVAATMRHDLVLDDDGSPVPGWAAVPAGLAAICAREDMGGVVAVIVDDRYPPGDHRYHEICALIDEQFDEIGGLTGGFMVPAFVEGARWVSVWTSRSGPTRGRIGDPHTSPTAIHHAVHSGRRILARRSEMENMLAPAEHCEGPHGEPADDVIEGLEDAELLRAILVEVAGVGPGRRDRDRATGLHLDCETTTLLGAALVRLPVRDAALALAVTGLRHRAEALWRELTRRLTGAQRASAATMLAHLHYIGGEGGYAGVALDCALEADPKWSLAVLLDTALRNGIRPRELWAMIDDCYEIARSLGVPIPQPMPDLEAG